MEQNYFEGIECRVCKNANKEDFTIAYQKNDINIVCCQKCGFVFIPAYYRKKINYEEYKNDDVLKAVISGNDWLKEQLHRERIRMIRKYCPRQGRLFDLGIGWGHFLSAGRKLGYEVSGIEMSKQAFIYAKDYLHLPNIERIDFFDYTPESEYYDIVTMWDVLEHIDLCDKVVEKVATMLKKGGYFVIQVPAIDSCIAKKEEEKWQGMGIDHVNYFSRKTISKLLNDNGFELKHIRSSIELKHFLMFYFFDKKRRKQQIKGVANTAERQEYFNKTVNRSKWQMKLMVLANNLICRLLSCLNIGDEMIVIAQKKS